MVAAGRSVVEQFRRAADGRNHNVDLAVVVQVAERAAAVSRANLHAGPGFGADVPESSVVQVAKHGVGLPVVLLYIDVGVLAYMRVGGEQVFVSVIVEVLDARAPAAPFETAKSDASLVTVIAEESIAFVAEQRAGFATEGRHDQTGLAAVIQIAKIHAHAGNGNSIVGIGDEGLDADFIESFATTVLKKKIPVVVVGDKNIHPAIIVVVGNGNAHALADMLSDACGF